jgi:hypothetical protein
MSVPVDVRYFPRGGVRDAELEAMEVFKNVSRNFKFYEISDGFKFSALRLIR